MKIGFIGYGRHARANLYPSIKFLGYQIHAVCTTSFNSSNLGVKEQEAQIAYQDHKKMLESEQLDAVFISLDPAKQAEITIDCLRAGVNVFVEKSPGTSLSDANSIVQEELNSSKLVFVGYMKRYAPSYQKISELYKNGQIGKLISIDATFSCRNFTTNIRDYLYFAPIHYINLIRSFTDQIKDIKAFANIVDGHFAITISATDVNGICINIDLKATDSWSKLNEQIILTGTNGYLKFNNNENKVIHHINPPRSDKPRWQVLDEIDTIYGSVSTTGSGGNQDLYLRGFIPEVETFMDLVQQKIDINITDAVDNLNTIDMIERILEQVS
ncbi:Gfo/Idh/MocA family oxidoreductase [Candidatus Nomurabacteria bacterium]|uniref:Gfo/Idh/MocA family oxidoreductase n=1 Tax=Candidatus Dojkabacteria bacterium TaxID=2099670 RepID=A0A955I330_9BACT|nr:Gfo/Idh/MocA family oxidoreductase [Candidatus Dojkabacteria bacterium]MCB9790268.1 Gfo/Idh/MocA family oxidoreductase [Candidatus Nomurabacteria bacterium]MCB9803211.1 Gfo/Idh/MocA family oxidoreductase [Candidatus Nomurabacteria bacterium]